VSEQVLNVQTLELKHCPPLEPWRLQQQQQRQVLVCGSEDQ
jgi:hypothetical protein